MDTSNLPRQPGLQRRLAYGEMIRRRNRDFHYRWHRNRLYMLTQTLITIQDNGFSYEQLVNLPVVDIGLTRHELVRCSNLHMSSGEEFCAICQETAQNSFALIRELLCGHSFHVNCIDTWLNENVKCPLCGVDLRTLTEKPTI